MHWVTAHPLRQIIPLYNIDGTWNRAGKFTHYVRLNLVMGQYHKTQDSLITKLGSEDVILGLPWLQEVNPLIDWVDGRMEINLDTPPEPAVRTQPPRPTVEEAPDKDLPHVLAAQPTASKYDFEADPEPTAPNSPEPIVEAKVDDDPTYSTSFEPFEHICINWDLCRKLWKRHILEDMTDELWCAAGFTYSAKLAEKAGRGKATHSFVDIVPEEYWQYSKVFSEVESERLPKHCPYDHPIELKPDTPDTICSKVYPMPVNIQEELDRFLDETL